MDDCVWQEQITKIEETMKLKKIKTSYTDTQPFPVAPVTWTYRAIYRVDDDHTGQWSLPVSVTVPA